MRVIAHRPATAPAACLHPSPHAFRCVCAALVVIHNFTTSRPFPSPPQIDEELHGNATYNSTLLMVTSEPAGLSSDHSNKIRLLLVGGPVSLDVTLSSPGDSSHLVHNKLTYLCWT